ncbi:MAG: aspartate-semialdehyde dehydrogenase [Elusimicrobia bacterium RIFOXYD2_FULL_34_15]|nr:MAG: aspartate-semialdehyde dehydrogenase [Elusimicrobia bacterium RIFOXYD2_FULL_34_15]
MKKYNIAVVGATGAVGIEMLKMLETRDFPVDHLYLFASSRTAGQKMKFKNREITVEDINKINDYSIFKTKYQLNIALFSAGASVSKEWAPRFAEQGVFVVDNSSCFRMEKDVPLVVPEVNPHDLSKDKKIIANPNCSTIQMVVVLKPIHDAVKIKRIIVSTYQAVSGAGGKALEELKNQTLCWAKGEKIPQAVKLPYQIAFNVIPQIDIFLDNAYTKEEIKMLDETQKIMGDSSIKVSATCVRVPVFLSHSESVWIETEQKMTASEARDLLKNAEGVIVVDEPSQKKYPLPIDAAGQQVTYVGRIREDITTENGLVMWIVSDNLLKGAALNAVQIAEILIAKGFC